MVIACIEYLLRCIFAGYPRHEFGCVIRQTNNGRRIDSAGVYGTSEEAIRGGLDDLRKDLGWS